MSYNFWQYKTFSEEEARKHYEQSEEIAPMAREPSEWQARVDENIGLLTDMVKKHPETEFYFFPAALFRALVGQRVPERADGGISLCQTGGDGSADCI